MDFMMCFLGITIVPREIEDNAYANFSEDKQGVLPHYERCTIGEMRHLAAKHDSHKPL